MNEIEENISCLNEYDDINVNEKNTELELKLTNIVSEEELNHFAKRKIIQLNFESSHIVRNEEFSYTPQIKKDNDLMREQSTLHFQYQSLKVRRFSYEYIKNNNFFNIEKIRLVNLFKKHYNDDIPIRNRGEVINENQYIIDNFEYLFSNLKYNMIINENKKIFQDKELINSLKENSISFNLPVMYNSLNKENIFDNCYLDLIKQLISKINILKDNLKEVKEKSAITTNITINNNLYSPSKKLMEDNIKLLNSINNLHLPIEKFSFHLTSSFFRNLQKKGKTLSFIKKRNKEKQQSLVVLDEKVNETIINKLKDKINIIQEKFIMMRDIIGKWEIMIDKRLITNMIIKIFDINTNKKIKKELLEKLCVILNFDSNTRKLLSIKENLFYEPHLLDDYFPIKKIDLCLNEISECLFTE